VYDIPGAIERLTRIRFQLKDLRSSYATITYASSPEMKDAISKQMRHTKSSTTEKYCIAYDQKKAANQLREEWKKTKIIDRSKSQNN